METINWAKAIEKNRDALVRIVAVLFSIAGLDDNETVATLPRVTRNYLARILRPAESAVRRLIIIAARNMSADVRPSRSVILGLGAGTRQTRAGGEEFKGGTKIRIHSAKGETATKATNRAFPLLDPLKRFSFEPPRRYYATTMPRVRSLSGWSLPVYMREPEPPAGQQPSPGDPVDAANICRRLVALKRALEDLDRQAKRLARWQGRRDRSRQQLDHKPGRLSPMRPGWPPGHRKRAIHEIDEILRECHSLAVYAQKPDTS